MKSLYITIEQEGKPQELITEENITGYRIEVPVGAVLSIVVQTSGYEDWELVVRFKQAKYLEGPVEMDKIPAEQG